MRTQEHYVQWQHNVSNSFDEKIVEIMKHWQSRYELGATVLLTDSPSLTLKAVSKQWRKLTRQAQKVRETKQTAEDILGITRTISRMQRVKFTSKSPEQNSSATFYVLKPDDVTTLPSPCFTLYSVGETISPHLLEKLTPDALVVLYQSRQPELAHLKNKSVLEDRVTSEESELTSWLHHHKINLEELGSNMEAANEALDTLLGSTNLQTEFLHKTKLFFHTLQLAQPLKLSSDQLERLHTLERLEKHLRLLVPSFLTDHIADTSSDSFLLRDFSSGNVMTLQNLRAYISKQYELNNKNLALALEHKAGFIRI